MDAGQSAWPKAPKIMTADSPRAGGRAGSPGHYDRVLPGSALPAAAAAAPTVYQGVVIQRLECRQLSVSTSPSHSPVVTTTGRSSSSGSCSGEARSSSTPALEAAEAADHVLCTGQQHGASAVGGVMGPRLQQVRTQPSQQQQEAAPAAAAEPAPLRHGLPVAAAGPRPAVGSSKQTPPALDASKLQQPTCYIQKRKMMAQARQRLHATAPERLVGLALPFNNNTGSACFNRLVDQAGEAAAAASSAAAAAGAAAAASSIVEGRAGSSPVRKRGAYNTRRSDRKEAAAAADRMPEPAAPVARRRGRRAAKTSPPAAAAAAVAAGSAAAAAGGDRPNLPERQGNPPAAPSAPAASGPMSMGAMGSVYETMAPPPAWAMSGTIITAAALTTPPSSPPPPPPAAAAAAAAVASEAAAGASQPLAMDMASSGAACIGWSEPSILSLGGGVPALGVYDQALGASGVTALDRLQCQAHQQPPLAPWGPLPPAGAVPAAAAGGGGGMTALQPAAAAAAGGGVGALRDWVGLVGHLGHNPPGWHSSVSAAPHQVASRTLQRNSSSMSSTSVLWAADKDPSPRPRGVPLPPLFLPPFTATADQDPASRPGGLPLLPSLFLPPFAATAAGAWAAAAAAAGKDTPIGAAPQVFAGMTDCGTMVAGSCPVVDVSGVMDTLWGEQDGSLDAVLDRLVKEGMEEAGSVSGPGWLEGWEQELQLPAGIDCL